MRYRCSHLAHPTDGNKCTTSINVRRFDNFRFLVEWQFQISSQRFDKGWIILLTSDLDHFAFRTHFIQHTQQIHPLAGSPMLLNDRSQGTGFLELENDLIDSYPCNGYCLQDIESKFTSADTVLAAERCLLTASGVKMYESSGIANVPSLSMLNFFFACCSIGRCVFTADLNTRLRILYQLGLIACGLCVEGSDPSAIQHPVK